MKRILLYILIFLGTYSLLSAENLKLKDAIATALENNFSIKIIKKANEIANNNVSYGNSGMLPKIDASASGLFSQSDIDMDIAAGGQKQNIKSSNNPQQNINAAIELKWTLFDGFAMFVSYDKYSEIERKSQIEVQIAIENLIKNIYQTYLEAVRLEEQVEILEQSIGISNDRLNRLKTREEFGTALKLEILKAKVDLDADSSQYLQLELNLSGLKRNLSYLMGIKPTADFSTDNNIEFIEMKPINDIKAITFQKNSSLNKALTEKRISEYDYELVNSAYYPRLNFSTNYNYSNTTSDAGFMLKNQSNGFNIGLNASVNLYDGMKSNILAENAKINILVNDEKLNDLKNQIALQIENAYDAYQKRQSILEMEERNFASAQQNFERSLELNKLGQINSTDFRTAQLALQSAQTRISKAKYDLKLSETEILIISGEYFLYN